MSNRKPYPSDVSEEVAPEARGFVGLSETLVFDENVTVGEFHRFALGRLLENNANLVNAASLVFEGYPVEHYFAEEV